MNRFQPPIVICAWLVLVSACASSQGEAPATISAPADCRPAEAWLSLRQSPPADSVILHRGHGTILLSGGDVEAYLARWPSEPDVQHLLASVRREIRVRGWVRLGEGAIEDMIVAYALRCGLAAVRPDQSMSYVSSVRTVLERDASNPILTNRAFYLPDGSLLWRTGESTVVP